MRAYIIYEYAHGRIRVGGCAGGSVSPLFGMQGVWGGGGLMGPGGEGRGGDDETGAFVKERTGRHGTDVKDTTKRLVGLLGRERGIYM